MAAPARPQERHRPRKPRANLLVPAENDSKPLVPADPPFGEKGPFGRPPEDQNPAVRAIEGPTRGYVYWVRLMRRLVWVCVLALLSSPATAEAKADQVPGSDHDAARHEAVDARDDARRNREPRGEAGALGKASENQGPESRPDHGLGAAPKHDDSQAAALPTPIAHPHIRAEAHGGRCADAPSATGSAAPSGREAQRIAEVSPTPEASAAMPAPPEEPSVTRATAPAPVAPVDHGGALHEPDGVLAMSWGRVGSLLNRTAQPSRTTGPESANPVAVHQTPWTIWTLGAVFGVGIGMGTMVRLVRRADQRKKAPASAQVLVSAAPTLPELLQRVREVPYDAQACFRLAVMMLQQGAESDGLRYLDRSFHLDPLYVLKLLKDDSYEGVRQQNGVRELLMKIKRAQDHRAWSGYA